MPLLQRAYKLWAQLEQETGRKLYHRTGLLLAGPPQGEVILGVKKTARTHGLDIEEIDPADFGARFAGFAASEHMAAVYESDAGYLRVEDCVRSHAERAVARGARIATRQTVREWSANGDGVVVTTGSDTYAGDKLVICGGAWSSRLLVELGLPLEIRRKVLMWFEADDVYREDRGCPVFGFEIGDDLLYGFPMIDDSGCKVAKHTGGEAVTEPERLDRELRESDRREIESFLASHLPRVTSRMIRSAVCMYTMTTDEHFIIDRHPEFEQVAFAAGFSGHGFKFAPVIGSVLADLVVDGRRNEEIDFLSMDRSSLDR